MRTPAGDALEDLAVGLDQAVEQPVRLDAGLAEHRHRGLIAERRVDRPVELHVPRAGGDRRGHLLALDLDHALDHVGLGRVDPVGDAGDEGEREPEDRGGREGDLEGVVGERRQVGRLAGGGAVDRVQLALHDRQAGVELDLAVLVGERHLAGAGREAVDGVVEGAGEHEAPELPVGDDVEADVELAAQRLADRLVLGGVQRAEVLRPLLGQERGVPGLVDLLDQALEPLRAKQAADLLRARDRPRRLRRAHLVCRGRAHGSSPPVACERCMVASDPARAAASIALAIARRSSSSVT